MAGYFGSIEKDTEENDFFRKVLFTGKHEQLVVMSLKPGEDIGEETHRVDQFIRVEQEQGVVVMGRKKSRIQADSAFVIPARTKHNVINKSKNKDLKIYTVYSSPQHEDRAIHKTKEQAEEEEE